MSLSKEYLVHALSNIPKKERKIIESDLIRYSEGFPEGATYVPITWVGKQPIQISKGTDGIMEFLEYVSDTKEKRTLKTILMIVTIVIVGTITALLTKNMWTRAAEAAVVVTLVLKQWVLPFLTTKVVDIVEAASSVSSTVSKAKGVADTATSLVKPKKKETVILVDKTEAKTEAYLAREVAKLAEASNCKPGAIATPKEIEKIARIKPQTVTDFGTLFEGSWNISKIEKYGPKLVEAVKAERQEISTEALK